MNQIVILFKLVKHLLLLLVQVRNNAKTLTLKFQVLVQDSVILSLPNKNLERTHIKKTCHQNKFTAINFKELQTAQQKSQTLKLISQQVITTVQLWELGQPLWYLILNPYISNHLQENQINETVVSSYLKGPMQKLKIMKLNTNKSSMLYSEVSLDRHYSNG